MATLDFDDLPDENTGPSATTPLPPPPSTAGPATFDALPDQSKMASAQTGALASGLAGFEHGATAGWSDQYGGLTAASGFSPAFQMGAPGLAAAGVGAARLAYEHFTGQRGPASQAYDQALLDIQKRTQQMQAEHPYVYGAGELGGAGISMLAVPEARAATWGARALQGAKLGAGYGALSGASSGQENNGMTGAVEGAGEGAVEGAAGGIGGELLGNLAGKAGQIAYDYLGRPITSAVRGLVDPMQEAGRRVAGALMQDYPQVAAGKTLGMTPQQWVAARAAGQPVMLADLGGETTRALMRSAANSSPEGRAALQDVIDGRFAEQSERAGSTIRGLVSNGANTAKTKAQLEAEYDAERGGAYQAAYDAGDRPVWSPELERLSSSPTVAGAIRGAVNRWKDFQVKDGYGGMNPPVNVTPDGQLQFLGGKGMLPYPNLQLWDYASRNLAGMASQARRAGNMTDAGLYGGLEQQLKAELDRQVPQFSDARGIAAKYFGGNNAIEAGQNAVNFKGDVSELKQAMAGMKPAERDMFQEAYADQLARNVENTSDRQDITGRLLNSPQARQRFGAVMGPGAGQTMDAFLSREKIYDAARKALGNSTTVRQMMEAGLAGGLGGLALTGDPKQALEIGAAGAGLGAGAGASGLVRHGVLTAGKNLLGYVDRNTASKVAQLLASTDPAEINRGLQVAGKNRQIADGLRDMAAKASAMFGAAKVPRFGPVQLPGAVGAEPQQQNVPGPVPAQQNGGRVQQQQRAAGGRAIESRHESRLEHNQNIPARANGGRVDHRNIDPEPTQAQKEAGNYAKDHVRIHGLDITIENAKGGVRRGVDRGGKPWEVVMPAAYGYIKGTVGKDKDHVDVYLGDHLKSPHVFVVDQVDADSRKFDEHKVFIGFGSLRQAEKTYHKAFSDGRGHERIGHIAEMPIEAFKRWLENGDTTAPIKKSAIRKHTKREAEYRAGKAGHRCGVCMMFRPPSSCTIVHGAIREWGGCKFFQPKSSEKKS